MQLCTIIGAKIHFDSRNCMWISCNNFQVFNGRVLKVRETKTCLLLTYITYPDVVIPDIAVWVLICNCTHESINERPRDYLNTHELLYNNDFILTLRHIGVRTAPLFCQNFTLHHVQTNLLCRKFTQCHVWKKVSEDYMFCKITYVSHSNNHFKVCMLVDSLRDVSFFPVCLSGYGSDSQGVGITMNWRYNIIGGFWKSVNTENILCFAA